MVLGFVSLTGMQTDLLPNMNLPYLLVITTYPGASPEQVESDVTQPLENSLSTLNGVKNVTSQSNENYSLVILEYQDDTDMDSAMVKASTAVNQLSDSLPDMVSTPTLMEMSPDMMATQYVAVDYEGMDIYELSDYVEDTIVPQLERVDGVASVSTTGLVKKSVQITLEQDKIDEVNDKLLVKVSDRLAEAKKQLDENEAKIKDGLAELDSAQSQLDSGKAQLNTQKQSLTQQLRDAIDQLNEEIPKLEEQIAGLKTQLDTAQSKLNQLKVWITMTYHDIKHNAEVNELLKKGNQNLGLLGFTDHSQAHCIHVAETAAHILKKFDYSAHDIELAKIAGYMHDIGNAINRTHHAEYGGLLANEILKQYDLSVADRITIVSAISNHDESTGGAVDPISAALIIGDKTDVRRSRVREKPKASFDIHDRVNYAVTDQTLKINTDKKVISLNLQIDTDICSMYEYFEIFLNRMLMCRGAADLLGATFKLTANGAKVL